MKRLESIITVIFLLMVCVASIQQAQSWNNDGVVGLWGSRHPTNNSGYLSRQQLSQNRKGNNIRGESRRAWLNLAAV